MSRTISSTRCSLLAALVVLASGAALHALPPDVEQLIQADKYAEALAKVELLLKATPADRELLAAKQELTALAGKPAPVPARLPPKPAAPATPATIPPLDAKELDLILADLAKATGDTRQKLLGELMSKTAKLTKRYKDIASLWAIRGVAAIELEDLDAAWESGQKLKTLGALESQDNTVITFMAALNRKGLLDGDLKKIKAEAAVARQAELRKRLDDVQRALIGKWGLVRASSKPTRAMQVTGLLTISQKPDGKLHISGNGSGVDMGWSGWGGHDVNYQWSIMINDQILSLSEKQRMINGLPAQWKELQGSVRDTDGFVWGGHQKAGRSLVVGIDGNMTTLQISANDSIDLAFEFQKRREAK